jgi:hypothetical protein
LYSAFLQSHRILSTNNLINGFLKESSHRIFQEVGRRYQHLFEKVFCQLRTNGDRWYWQLDLGSKLTIVSLLHVCLRMTLCTILYLTDGWGHRLSFIELMLYITTSVSRKLNILLVFIYNKAIHICEGWHFTQVWKALAWPRDHVTFYWSACTKLGKSAVMYLCVRGIHFLLIRFFYWILELFRQCGIFSPYDN